MAPPLPISCFIISLNEADRIARTIRSVRALVAEVVVVDSGSTDGTQVIATSEGARVIINEWPGFGQQKRFAEDQCRNNWLLNLDADEVLTPELAEEIRGLFASGVPPLAVYGMRVSQVYPGAHKPRLWARDHYCLRLYDRRRVRFKNSTLHDSVDPDTERVGNLSHDVYHFSVRSLDDLIAKCDARARYNAEHSKPKSRLLLATRLVLEFPVSFLKYYFLRLHITGGLMGFQFAMIVAFFRFVRIARLRQATAVERKPV